MSKRICSVNECGKPVHGRGLCSTHYRRAYRSGDPSVGPIVLCRDADIWRAVPGYDGYRVTADGRISGRGGLELRPMVNDKGYLYVIVQRPGVPRKLFIHRAVLLTWVGPPAPGQTESRHLNHDPSDNRVENLAWGSAKDNAADKAAAGRQIHGEAVHSAKLTEAQVREIRRRWPSESFRAIAKAYGISGSHVAAIVRRTKWARLQ